MKIGRSDIKKILVVAPNWIGDAVMTLPAISRIRKDFPSARVTLLGLPHISEIFRECPIIDEIKVYSTKEKNSGVAAGFSLRSGNFDMAILFPNSFKSALIARLAGIPIRAGYNRDGRGFLLNVPVRFDAETKRLHQIEYYLNLINPVSTVIAVSRSHERNEGEAKQSDPKDHSGQSEEPRFEIAWLYVSKAEEDQALHILSKHHITPADLIIGINPGAAYGSAKRWYPERFGEVARSMIERYHAKVIVFGSEKETDIAEEIVENAGVPLVNMAGRTSIRELMALISQCRLFITNDSGPMHIAAALRVSVVAIFGSTDPQLTGPGGTGHIVIKKAVPCSPCFKRQCPTDLMCMDLVSVDNVLGGVGNILEWNKVRS